MALNRKRRYIYALPSALGGGSACRVTDLNGARREAQVGRPSPRSPQPRRYPHATPSSVPAPAFPGSDLCPLPVPAQWEARPASSAGWLRPGGWCGSSNNLPAPNGSASCLPASPRRRRQRQLSVGKVNPPLPSPPPSAASLSQPDLGRGWRGGWGESWCCWCCWRQTRRLSRAIRNRVPWLGMGWCRSSVLPSFSSAAWGESWARDVVADLPREVGSGRQAEACCLHEAGSEPGSAFSRLRSQDLGKPIECHLPPLGKDGLPGCLSAPVCVWAPACSVGWAPGTGTGMCLQGWGS